MSAPVDCEPEVALTPDQAPEALQESASVDDQVSVAVAPLAIDPGLAASDTVGWMAPPVVESELEVAETPTGLPTQPATATASTGTSNSVFVCNMGILVT